MRASANAPPTAVSRPAPRLLARWLLVVAALIVAIVAVGGITRLTESGLSITEWKPVSGTLPPLTHAAWAAAFADYRRIDQYQAIHGGMTLGQFKRIFFWEYFHRLLGRVIGLAVALPLAWFAIRRQVPQGYGLRLLALLALVGLQGTLGWLMVRSGLHPGRIEVAPGWLAAHLLTALFSLCGFVWTALDLLALARNPAARPARLTGLSAIVGALLAVQLLYGALMAGLRAGLVSDSWPLMDGRLFPGESRPGEPLGAALVGDPAIVHFVHRWWAWVVVAGLLVLARRARAAGDRPASIAIHAAFGTQIVLGIATVLSGVALPLAALHQLVGALLTGSVAWGAHAVGRRG